MAISGSYSLSLVRLVIGVLMILILSPRCVPSESVADELSSTSYTSSIGSEEVADEVLHRKKVLGSRPPTCVNKCMSCRPCMATLVIPPPRIKTTSTSVVTNRAYKQSFLEDDRYYLLSWKCKCGDKLFQP